MPPLRVLQVVPAMDMGGLEMFIMNVYRHIDRQKVQFDFLYHYSHPCVFDDEIEALGGHIFRSSVREDNKVFNYLLDLEQFFKAHPYPVLHGHFSGFGAFYNHAAKKHGVAVRIGHSHNTQTEKSLTGLADAVLSSFLKYSATHRFSCGEKAGRALFGNRSFEIYPNGIEVDRFLYDPQRDVDTRARLGLADAVVYGHIGRFTQQKNHEFLLDIFAEIAKRQPEARLLLAGDGPLLPAAEQHAAQLSIEDKVLFAGIQKDTPGLYSAMNAFVLPSLFEGFPVVLVEAQASGMPIFASDAVSPEAALTESVQFLPLSAGAEGWAKAILENGDKRRDNRKTLFDAGYNTADTAQRLQEFYLSHAAPSPKHPSSWPG